MQVGDAIELTPMGMAFGGEAFGRADDGRMVFVPFALPGERLRLRLTEVHARWARGTPLERLETHPSRVEPRCRHFGECGGCHYQHMDYAQQLEAKTLIVRDQLKRIGGIADPPLQSMIGSPTPWNYRNRIRFHVTESGQLGFHNQSGDRLIPVQECHLPVEAINQAWPLLEFEPESGIQQVELRFDNHERMMVNLLAQGPPQAETDIEMEGSVVWLDRAGPSHVLAGEHFGWMQVKDQTFRVSAGAFFQTHGAQIEPLVDLVLDLAAVVPGQLAFDLYAGVGLFSLFLAEAGAAVAAVESSDAACADFGLNLDRYPDISLYQAEVEQALPSMSDRPDLIVADPPRAGLSPTVVDEIARRQPARFVYVSCDPATLSRDAKRLINHGFELRQVAPIDLFPQTFHIESVSLWQPREGSG